MEYRQLPVARILRRAAQNLRRTRFRSYARTFLVSPSGAPAWRKCTMALPRAPIIRRLSPLPFAAMAHAESTGRTELRDVNARGLRTRAGTADDAKKPALLLLHDSLVRHREWEEVMGPLAEDFFVV